MIIALQTLIFFRESLLAVIYGLFRPYYKRFLTFSRQSISDDEESEDQVFSEFDDEKGVVFYPPMYAQRYAAVTDCLMDERWCGKLEKVVDLGYHDVSFIKYLKEIPGVKRILGVDLESIPLRCSSDLVIEYTPKRENPLQVTLFQGNAADPDYRLIGSDAVVAIEMIEHMLPHDLDRLIHTIFGFVKPWIAVFTTPNGDFNPLFKALEKNGLRRLDHFFEWSREQFHDWCSNIVLRYPQYTVVCKGVGPGPPGTLHHGCCSQLALFMCKDYSKQQDLDMNSLAVVANTKDNNDLSELIGSLESGSEDTERHMLCLPSNNMDSYLDLLSQSVSTLMATAMTIVEPVEYTDNTSQCNIDDEIGKNFLMFEDECCLKVMIPRKKIVNRVYDIEDVANRLNCSTLQVKRFSKTTQNLMAKNKIDSLVHTREVVDEIRHLTKMLNFKGTTSDRGDGTWCNFNWGDNAPYWNQYYKLVREYSYPFETKSEEGRIIDLISEEINRLIDSQYDEEFSVDMNKMEIPLTYLMKVVDHITTDVDRVKDILEWNGYEIVNDVVLYTRLVESASVTTRDECWQDNDTLSDFDTSEVHTTSLSDGSTMAPDYTGRCLQRALDHKVRKLRSMLSADEDIASELDRVVCRLMKLALRTCRTRQHPPPTKWMQCKLFDLLSLTEKAIDRRRKRFIENFPLNALEYDEKVGETLAVAKLKNDDLSVNKLVDKYQNLVQSYESKEIQKVRNKSNFGGFDFDEDLSDTSNEFTKEFERVNNIGPSDSVLIGPMPKVTYEHDYTKGIEESKLERIQAWVDEDLEVVPYPNHDVRLISSGDTDHSATNMTRHKLKKMSRTRKLTLLAYPDKQDPKIRKKCLHQKSSAENNTKTKIQEKNKTSKSKLKKASTKKSSYCLLVKANLYKTSSNSFGKLRNKKVKEYTNPNPSPIKPIPDAFKDLCHPDLNGEYKLEENIKYLTNVDRLNDSESIENATNVSATQESLLVDIVMDGFEETIALRRTIGTDADEEPIEFEQETVLGSLLNVMRNVSFCNNPDIETENVHSQTIFLNDINEPSTSKGVRHVSMDVQCGPDVTPPAFSTLSTTTSFTRIPKIFSTGIKIGDSEMEVQSKINSDFGTCTGDNDCYCKTITPRFKSVGIKIKDSDTNIKTKTVEFTMTQTDEDHDVGSKETETIKPISSHLKIEDSGSEYHGSVASYRKSPMTFESTPGLSEVMLKSSTSKDAGLGPKYTCMKYVPPKLTRGGVYVHSYKDKQQSEDILYQGEWQRCRPKALTKKRVVFSTASVKKLSDLTKKLRISSQEKIQKAKPERSVMKLEQKNLQSIQVRTPNCELTKSKEKNIIKINTVPNKAIKTTKYNRIVTKTSSSKLTKSSLSSNKPKTGNVLKRPPMLSSKVIRKEPESAIKGIIKSTEAKTLKRIVPPTKSILNKSFDSAKIPTKNAKEKPIGHVVPLVRSKTEYIKKELLKFDDSPRDNISYVVLRNDSDNKNNNKKSVSPKTNSFRKSDSTHRRNLSPQSQNSSTCSSHNSIATVRLASRSRAASRNPGSETPIRNKKFTKKNRIIKKIDVNDLDDKENIPESSNGVNKDNEGKAKNTYITTQKSVYRAQVKTENLPIQNPLNSLARPKTSTPKKTSLKTSDVDGMTRASRSSLVTDSKSSSLSSPEKVRSSYRASSPQISTTLFSWSTQLAEIEQKRSHSLPREVNSDRNIAMSLKKMIEDRLDFIRNSSDDVGSIDSKTVILSRENLDSSGFDESATPDSYKTVINNEDLNTIALQNDLESAVNRTFDSLVDSTGNDDNGALTDTDVLSFKTTTAASRASEYFLADNELDDFESFSKVNSVRDIFERKDPLHIQSNGSTLAGQAFSGFSISAVAGDQPDPINFMGSETGSLTVDLGRQATSEEVFVSGRSSGSYESCLYDDDALLPYWLFHINDQFADEEEDEQEPAPPAAVELPEPQFDMNGNVVAAGAGAGDGRGMHSDHSQDSSGRGTTSTTSSDPSSGVQSEAILIDPSAFTGQYELPAAAVAAEIPDVPLHEAGEYIGEAVADRNGRRNPVVQLLATSDMDADVSSLDTDVQDSS